ncbi:MAG TPA: hypothetical protein VFD27_03195 [Chthoniobacteraceae bacterium]|nr:hypothetical protein [Chthoniobacteraceae bacterium]
MRVVTASPAHHMKSSHFLVIAAAVFTLSWAPVLPAAIYDLSATGTVVVPNPNGNAIFSIDFLKTTGTGVFNPFLTILETGTEQGYNGETQPFDTKRAPQYTHELRLSDLTISTTQDGAQFYSFLIDINESNNPLTSFITLDALKIYTSPALQPEVTAVANIDSLGTKIFDLDALEDSFFIYDDANTGSGQGDIAFFIPVSAFLNTAPSDFVYIYEGFGASLVAGAPAGSNGGFEETSLAGALVLVTPVPEVGSLVPLIAVLGAVLGGPFVRRGFGKLSRQTT